MKTFVFDADGVVCIGSEFGGALEKEHGILRSSMAPFFKGPFSGCILGTFDLKDELAPYLSRWGWRGSIDEFLAFWFQSEHVMNAQILDCVRTLRKRGHTCVLGTNQEKYRAAYLRREMRLGDEFDHIFASHELHAAKPTRQFFKSIEGRLGQTSSNLCLIDDMEENVTGAQAAGWSAIHYRDTTTIPKVMNEASLTGQS